VNWLLSFDT